MPHPDRSKRRCVPHLASCLALSAASAATAGIIHVDDNAAPGGDGAGWTTAFRFLSDALSAAASGDEIRIAQGTYRPDASASNPAGTGNRNATFLVASLGLSLRGGYAGVGAADPDARDIALFPTVLSADLAGNDASGVFTDNSHHVMTSTGSSAVVLDGLSVIGGNAIGAATPIGGGILHDASTLSVVDCRLVGNRAERGGGLHALTGSVSLVGSAFIGNHAVDGSDGFGGGAYFAIDAGNFLVEACVFDQNSATSHGGAIHYRGIPLGGAPPVYPVIRASEFTNNAGGGVGAVSLLPNARPRVENCLFANGQGSALGGLAVWDEATVLAGCTFIGHDSGGTGALALWDNDGGTIWNTMVDCRFIENTCTFRGGAGMLVARSNVSNVVVSGAVALAAGAGFHLGGPMNLRHVSIQDGFPDAIELNHDIGTVSMGNCIVWNCGAAPVHGPSVSDASVAYSIVEGGFAGEGNVDLDPLFVAPDAHDLHLALGSPAIDAGSAALLPADTADVDGDGNTTEALPLDLDGNARVQGPAPDMGAFEGSTAYTPPMDEATGIDPGESAQLEVETSGALPAVSALIENFTGASNATAELVQVGWDPHPGASGMTEEGLVADLITTISAGAHRTQVRIPVSLITLWPHGDLAGMRVSRWDASAGAWRLAVAMNVGDAKQGDGGPVGAYHSIFVTAGVEPVVPMDLGDHGVIWYPATLSGFLFANVDGQGEFGIGRAVCEVDLNADGVIDGLDLGSMLAQWGGPGSGDFDANGTVDGADVAQLLANWGGCSMKNADDSADGVAGGGAAPIVPPKSIDPRLADVTRDGVVDGADLGLLTAAWGGGVGRCDLDGDGVVDGADLGLLLASWTNGPAAPR